MTNMTQIIVTKMISDISRQEYLANTIEQQNTTHLSTKMHAWQALLKFQISLKGTMNYNFIHIKIGGFLPPRLRICNEF